MSQITTITTQGQVTIPLAIRKILGLKPKDKVAFKNERGKIYIEPAENFLEMKGSIKSKTKYSDRLAEKSVLEYKKNEYKKK